MPLTAAVKNGRQDVVELLLECNCNVNERNSRGDTAAIIAAKYGEIECLETLLLHGANVNQRGYDVGLTPLMIAVKQGHLSCARLLLQYGSDVNMKERKSGKNALMLAVENGHLDCTQLLLQFGPNTEVPRQNGDTPLIVAKKYEREDIFIENRANVNQANSCDVSPLMVAAEMGNIECLRLLIRNDASINVRSKDGD